MSFKVGDVVRLKSGGMSMTVDLVRDSTIVGRVDRIFCVWHTHDGTAQIADYSADMLVKATATSAATGEEVPVESILNSPETWRISRGL